MDTNSYYNRNNNTMCDNMVNNIRYYIKSNYIELDYHKIEGGIRITPYKKPPYPHFDEILSDATITNVNGHVTIDGYKLKTICIFNANKYERLKYLTQYKNHLNDSITIKVKFNFITRWIHGLENRKYDIIHPDIFFCYTGEKEKVQYVFNQGTPIMIESEDSILNLNELAKKLNTK